MAGRDFFVRHPATVIASVVGVAFVALLGITEHYLATRNEGHLVRVGVDRYVRLRELPPGQSVRYWSERWRKTIELDVDMDGYIVPSKPHAAPDVSVAFLGGSTTECYAVDPEKRFPRHAGRVVERETGLKVNAINSGVSGNTTMHSLNILLNKLVAEKPDIVVMMHNLNDLAFLIRYGAYEGEQGNRTTLVNASVDPASSLVNIRDRERSRLFRHLLRGAKHLTVPHTWDAVQIFLNRMFSPQGEGGAAVDPAQKGKAKGDDSGKYPYDRTAVLDLFDRNLTLFVAIARSAGVVPVLMSQFSRYAEDPLPAVDPNNPTPLPDGEFRSLHANFNERIREVARRLEVPLIDLAAEVPGRPELIYDAVHLTDAGSLLVGEIVGKKLLPLVEGRRPRASGGRSS